MIITTRTTTMKIMNMQIIDEYAQVPNILSLLYNNSTKLALVVDIFFQNVTQHGKNLYICIPHMVVI